MKLSLIQKKKKNPFSISSLREEDWGPCDTRGFMNHSLHIKVALVKPFISLPFQCTFVQDGREKAGIGVAKIGNEVKTWY